MKESPIIFSGEMVRAILDGRKTQMRRPVKWPVRSKSDGVKRRIFGFEDIEEIKTILKDPQKSLLRIVCPFGQVGDRLWVRESWCPQGDEQGRVIEGKAWYKADGEYIVVLDDDGSMKQNKNGTEASPWKPSIQMPRWASRITLEITDIRIQRVQELSYNDCLSEGVDHKDDKKPCQMCFQTLWDSLYAKKGFGWPVNPWVWAITFRTIPL